ncbi:hypothetical protein ASB57_02170 [Bordetella sp. N]|nr:hypothetical protein ASB57_02170 [Bordetella sp. N]
MDIRPLIVRERHVKLNWLIWPSCAFGALMALGFVMSSGSGHGFIWFLLLALTSLLYKPFNDLRRGRYVRLWGVTGLEANESGDVFITELGGACPTCGGELTLRTAGGGRAEMGRSPFYTLVACKDYRDHHWHFNRSSLNPLRNDDDHAAPSQPPGPFG